MPGYYSDLRHDVDYTSLPNLVDTEELDQRVTALRAGDHTQVNPISMQLMRITMSVVARYAHPKRTPDLVGVALLTLVESVARGSTELVDNNIIPYIMTNVNHRLKDAIDDDHTLRIPSRTLRHKKKQGVTVQLYENRLSSEEAPATMPESRQHAPAIARQERPSVEFMEILEKIVHDDRERVVLEMRMKSHTLQECAAALGVSLGTVANIKDDLHKRYLELA